jgi:hypothetical protein
VYKLFDLIRAVRAMMMPYEVQVVWEGELEVHRAWTVDDALAWVACYPVSARCIVLTRGYKFVCSRVSGARLGVNERSGGV